MRVRTRNNIRRSIFSIISMLLILSIGFSASLQVMAVPEGKDIYYVEVNNHSLIYHTANGNIISSGTLKQALNELGKYHFAQCNNCYLVNLAYVMEVNGYEVMVKGENLLISHPRKKAFLQELSRYLGQ